MGGYRFLMRYYQTGDDIYFFGFSRGAYVARFLAEMLDHVGLVSEGCEELVRFAWKTFARWQQRQDGTDEEKKQKKELLQFMRAFRETFSRPIRRIRFLGLFDTVNSVPRFETAWMQRSKFPYTARSSAKVIRHAVSIDERRAKFRQDLISGDLGKMRRQHHHHHHAWHHKRRSVRRDAKVGPRPDLLAVSDGGHTEHNASDDEAVAPDAAPKEEIFRPRRKTLHAGHSNGSIAAPSRDVSVASRDRSRSVMSTRTSLDDGVSAISVPHFADDEDGDTDDEGAQDIDEVWFAGCHADIGGGWPIADEESYALSHMPLVWMVREARRAGLAFDLEKLREFNCCAEDGADVAMIHFSDPFSRNSNTNGNANGNGNPVIPSIQVSSITPPAESPPAPHLGTADRPHQPSKFHEALRSAASRGVMHDSLAFNQGLPHHSVLSWRLMEYLPFRRMDLQPDGSWKPIRWPLPAGEVRDIPADAHIHNSVLARMKVNENYRPGNLIVGGGGRGVRVAPKHHGMGEWETVREENDLVGEILIRKGVTKAQ